MLQRYSPRSTRQRGATAVLWLFAMVPLLGIGALALDVNNLLVASTELQNAADSGALAGATRLYNNNGTAIQRATVINEATAAAQRNLARSVDSPRDEVEVSSVQIGHWHFNPAGGGQFTPTDSDTLPSLIGKQFFDPDLDECDNLNNACSGEINAVRVVTGRSADGSLVQAFLGGVLGFAGYPASAEAVAYLGYAGSVAAGEIDQPIGICMEKLVDENGAYQCSTGRFFSSDGGGITETGGWVSYDQPDTCSGGTNAGAIRGQVCSTGNPDPIQFGVDTESIGGAVNPAFRDLVDCWRAASGETEPWDLVLMVIQCGGGNPGPCNKVVGVVGVRVLHIFDQASERNNMGTYAPSRKGDWRAPAPADCPAPTPTLDSQEHGICRWNAFVEHFGILGFDTDGDGQPDLAEWNDNPQLNGVQGSTVYFAPSCDPQVPTGTSGTRAFGIRANVPVLVN